MKFTPAGIVLVVLGIGLVAGLLLGKVSAEQFISLTGLAFAAYYISPQQKQVTQQTPQGPIVTSYVAK